MREIYGLKEAFNEKTTMWKEAEGAIQIAQP